MRVRCLTALCAVASWLALATAAQAATFTVTTTADTFDGNCDPTNCSLRDAFDPTAANSADGNVVVIPAGTFRLNTTDNPPFGEIEITRDMTITGAGARATTVDANGRSRVFRVTPNSSSATFNDLTITGGHTPPVDPPGSYFEPDSSHGGGIYTRGALTLNRVAVRGNTAMYAGGGIMNEMPETGSLSTIDVNIDRSTISGNSVEGGVGLGYGGGITVFGNLTMTNASVIANSSSDTSNEGGGIVTASDLQVDSVIPRRDGTHARGELRPSGVVTLTNVTIAGNAVSGDTPAGNIGGGMAGDSGCCGEVHGPILYSDLHAKNTIIANNTANGVKQDCALVNTTSTDHNISSDGTCGFTDPGSRQATDPGLLPLENRGGPTDTMGLSATSAATNTGTNSGCPTIDQRGVVRPLVTTCDVGAVELALPTATTGDATNVKAHSATITGSAGNPHVDQGSVFFQFGTTLAYGTTTPAEPLAAGARSKRRSSRSKRSRRASRGRIKARAAAASFSASLTGLREGRVYHYRIGSTNRDGTAFGLDRTFRALRTPRVSLLGVPRSCVSRAFSFRVRSRVARQTKLRSVRVRLDGKLIKRSKSSNFTVRVNGSKLRSGRHTLAVRVTDRGGRTRLVKRAFRRCARPRSPVFTG